jgi:hypothetical protein
MNIKNSGLIIAVLFSAIIASSQNVTDKNLCVGAYYTEEEGAANLLKLKESYQTKEEWLKRAEIIKKGILEGAGLVPFPEKTPLNPRYTSERKYDGYLV